MAPDRWSSCPAARRDPCSKSGPPWRWCCRSIPPTTSACSHRWTGCLAGLWRVASTKLTLRMPSTKCSTLFNLIYILKARVAEIQLLAFALWPSTASLRVLINIKDKKRTPASSMGDRWQTISSTQPHVILMAAEAPPTHLSSLGWSGIMIQCSIYSRSHCSHSLMHCPFSYLTHHHLPVYW